MQLSLEDLCFSDEISTINGCKYHFYLHIYKIKSLKKEHHATLTQPVSLTACLSVESQYVNPLWLSSKKKDTEIEVKCRVCLPSLTDTGVDNKYRV